jgi:hypothetical protein
VEHFGEPQPEATKRYQKLATRAIILYGAWLDISVLRCSAALRRSFFDF